VRFPNEAPAAEIVCLLRYRRHYFMATGIHLTPLAARAKAGRAL
jgi:bacterioferritin